ncbi:Hypothetical protein LUCI_1496 [Lucifera butyrica]|uniref:Dihydroorotate dehydrogenase B (NAD(+)), electron transfer subunit n=1 Tax=Lucifera butyrica TaxID=1351585 RepID=A0A498R608_9FIRM|nr:dihydroorotate dehydrogenase electron transfer subunit [Lucifera butyrica]VBB06277.1 Hypothetical protein LUCI_1496 [Lucifera butyrica]
MPKTAERMPITKNRLIKNGVYELSFHMPHWAYDARPGQFVHIRIADSCQPLLRRPFSIAGTDAATGEVSVIYRVVGQGTSYLTQLKAGDFIDCLGPLGRPFDLECERPLLVGGGMGLAPLLFLARVLCPRPAEILMGGRTKEELFWTDRFATVCENIHITTDDGSLGQRGVTADVLPALLAAKQFDRIYTCGPHAMMQKVAQSARQLAISCQVSLEEPMACGLGACLSCTCEGQDGKRRKVCTDGPVFWSWEVVL